MTVLASSPRLDRSPGELQHVFDVLLVPPSKGDRLGVLLEVVVALREPETALIAARSSGSRP